MSCKSEEGYFTKTNAHRNFHRNYLDRNSYLDLTQPRGKFHVKDFITYPFHTFYQSFSGVINVCLILT